MRHSAPRYFPLGLGYSYAALRQAGHEVVFLDPEIKDSPMSPCSNVCTKRRRWWALAATTEFPGGTPPSRAPQTASDVVTVLGGIHASSVLREILAHHPEFDVLVVGEEETIVELAATIDGTVLIPNICVPSKALLTATTGRSCSIAVAPCRRILMPCLSRA